MKTYEIYINGELQPERIVNCPSIEDAYSTWDFFNKNTKVELKEYTGTDKYSSMFISCIV